MNSALLLLPSHGLRQVHKRGPSFVDDLMEGLCRSNPAYDDLVLSTYQSPVGDVSEVVQRHAEASPGCFTHVVV